MSNTRSQRSLGQLNPTNRRSAEGKSARDRFGRFDLFPDQRGYVGRAFDHRAVAASLENDLAVVLAGGGIAVEHGARLAHRGLGGIFLLARPAGDRIDLAERPELAPTSSVCASP